MRSHGDVAAIGVESTGSFGATLTRYLTDARRTSRRGQPAQPAGPAHGRQVRPARRRADRPSRPRADLDGDPEGQVRHGRGDPHPARDPLQRGQGPHPGVQHAVGRHDRRTLTAARRARGADQADPGQPVPAAAPRDRGPPRPGRPTRTGCSWPASRPPCGTWPDAGRQLDDEVKTLNRQIEALVRAAAPELVELHGVGIEIAGQFLVTAGDNADRIRNEAAFAKLCGVAPQPASSGRTSGRHRLSRGGDRAANSALYIVTIVRMRHHQPTRDYVERRTAEGLSKREIIRCLKRYIAREIYANLPRPAQAATTLDATSISGLTNIGASNASTGPWPRAGPSRSSTAPSPPAAPLCQHGSTSTTTTGPTPQSGSQHPSPG